MENLAWDVASARDHGVIDSYLQPLERAIPMVATADVGRVGAQLLREDWTGLRVVELEGPQRVSPLDAGRAFAEVLGRPVTVRAVPRERWGALFTAQGMRDPIPAFRCWTASMKAGSTSKVRATGSSRARSPWWMWCAR